ncbi:MAG TPA: hypothetical protein VFN67_10575 [Polyangiales bacterium]|nr:hypothetical protein [Polyangiales bacterium]
MAGLAAARVLSDRAQHVLVLDGDSQSDDTADAVPRKGVAQGRHVHLLLKSGEVVLERLFPGFCAELLAAGSHSMDLAREMAWFHARAWKPRCDDFPVHFQRRPVLEQITRRRTQAIENVELRGGSRVTSLVCERGRVVGVKVGEQLIAADLVVDASGRGSQVAKWITEEGFSKPPVDSVGIDVSYATAIVRLVEPPTEFNAMALYPALPVPGWGILFPIDHGQHIVTLMGYFDDVPSTERAGFIEFSARLGQPHIHALIHDADFVTEIARFHFKGTRYIRYDKAKHLPRGLVALGDAVCSFNPVFGQGMSTALMTAEVLEQMAQETLDIDPRAYFQRVAKTLAFPWKTGITEDFRAPQTTGRRPLGLRLNQVLTDLMNARASADAEFYREYVKVFHMIAPPSALLNPRMLTSMLLGSKTPLYHGPAVRKIKSASASAHARSALSQP